MRLKLVLRGPERIMGAQPEKSLEHGSLLIGRSPAADWVLPDPARIVSKNHCRIDRDFNGFTLTDTSTNGVTINGEPVGFGMPRQLGNGDVLLLGDVAILVHLEQAAPTISPQPAALPSVTPAPIAFPDDGPFGAPQAMPGETTLPSDSPATLAQAPAQKILDDWWLSQPSPAAQTEMIPVDIFGEEAEDEFLRTTQVQEPLRFGSGDVVSLVETHAGIDLITLARAVDDAASGLGEDQRQTFHERLRDFLAGNGSRSA
jgi:type VI secretion system FHA domain protein